MAGSKLKENKKGRIDICMLDKRRMVYIGENSSHPKRIISPVVWACGKQDKIDQNISNSNVHIHTKRVTSYYSLLYTHIQTRCIRTVHLINEMNFRFLQLTSRTYTTYINYYYKYGQE